METQGSGRRLQHVFVAFGRGTVLDHAPRWWERLRLAVILLFARGAPPLPADTRVDLAEDGGGPERNGDAGAGSRVPRHPPDRPLAGAVALPEPRLTDDPH